MQNKTFLLADRMRMVNELVARRSVSFADFRGGLPEDAEGLVEHFQHLSQASVRIDGAILGVLSASTLDDAEKLIKKNLDKAKGFE